jgi:hypothetical protein
VSTRLLGSRSISGSSFFHCPVSFVFSSLTGVADAPSLRLSLHLSLSLSHPDCFCLGCVCVCLRFLSDCLPSPRGGADATPLAKTIALVGGGGKGDPQLAASLGTVIDKAVTSFVASARDACPRDEGGGANIGGRAVQVHNAAALVLGAVKNVGGRDGSVAALAALSGDVIAPLFSSLEGWFRV